MAEVSIEKLASDIGTSVDRLVQQFKDSGVVKTATDSVTEEEKQKLLDHLSKQHGGAGAQAPKKMTLQRKTTSTLNLGKSRAVKVEVRKKRTYVKRSDIEEKRLAEEEAQRKEEEARVKRETEQKAQEEAKKAALEKQKKAEEARKAQEAERQARAEKAKKEAEERKASESKLTDEEKKHWKKAVLKKSALKSSKKKKCSAS
jgi:translation initiation factor IF-2